MIELSAEEKYWVWLSSIDGVFPKWFYSLQSVYMDPKSVYENADEILNDLPHFPPQTAESIKKGRNTFYWDGLFENIEKRGLSVTTAISSDYPYTLESLSDPPPVLYYRGILPQVWERSVSIVGTRTPTRNGTKFLRSIAAEISAQGILVVSGMARGIDTAAHMGAIDAGGKTVAVLGCSAETIYPKENREVYEQIIENGAVISEFRPGTPPVAENFPRRNRIIAALSDALIVSEGGMKSGARITADIALSLGKNVFAIPGDPSLEVSALPISLLKSGAILLSECADLMEEMNWTHRREKNFRKNKNIFGLDFFQEQIYNSLLKGDLTAEQLVDMLNAPICSVNSALTIMELSGAVNRLPGNLYCIG